MARPATTMALALIAGVIAATPAFAETETNGLVGKGKEIAFDRKKGNCLACHAIEGGESPGNIGPPLLAMSQRYPEREALRAQIWDATKKNPQTAMPPFGRHEILSESEIDAVVAFISSL